jgi:hypothetical protein
VKSEAGGGEGGAGAAVETNKGSTKREPVAAGERTAAIAKLVKGVNATPLAHPHGLGSGDLVCWASGKRAGELLAEFDDTMAEHREGDEEEKVRS